MTIDDWFDSARQDAERRALPEMLPVIEGLRAAAQRLRTATWTDDARGDRAGANAAGVRAANASAAVAAAAASDTADAGATTRRDSSAS